MLLTTHTFAVHLGGRPILQDIRLSVAAGEFLAILGPNGQGKSTLLHALSGGNSETQAQVLLHQRPLQQWSPLELAQQRAVLTQNIAFNTAMTCRDAVLLGRYPFYKNGSPTEQDHVIVDEVLAALQLEPLAERPLHTGSGGQQQLVQVARVLAQIWDSTPQDPKLLLLDEPTSNLDIRYQHLLLGQLQAWLPTKGWGIVAVLHDLNLAAQYAQRLILIHQGRIHTSGRPEEVLTQTHIQDVFGVPAQCHYLPGTQQWHCLIQPQTHSATTSTLINTSIMTPLQQQIQTYKTENPKARPYNIAQDLGVSELEVLEASTDKTITYLGEDYEALMKQLKPLGKVMALTRNEHAVSEIRGVYDNVSFMKKAPMGLAVNELIDMRYFTARWAHVYAIEWLAGKRQIRSFQIFDNSGHAVHKIYTTPATDIEVYQQLVTELAQPEGRQKALEAEPEAPAPAPALSEAEVADFQQAWLDMQDTHDFFGLLKKYSLQHDRQRAFEKAPEGHAYQVGKEALVELLEYVAEQKVPIMVFLGNGSCLQIFSGEVKRLVPMEAWYNILDRDFNLHLKLDAIANAWVVKKCTSDGLVTSLELFDKEGKHILYCFGKRKPGIPELKTWRVAIDQLAPLEQPTA